MEVSQALQVVLLVHVRHPLIKSLQRVQFCPFAKYPEAHVQEVLSVEELERLLTNKSGGVMLEGVYEGIQDIYYYALGM